jgi:hypothetical protein
MRPHAAHLLVVVGLVLAGCGGDDEGTAPTTVEPSNTTTTTTATAATTTTTAAPAVTLGALLDRIEARVNEGSDVRRMLARCSTGADGGAVDRSALVGRGMVLTCAQLTDPPTDVGELLVIVLDAGGTATGFAASDGTPFLPFNAAPGLLCRELLADPLLQGLGDQTVPYRVALAYWFLEGEPARMDADGDGIPCEQLFPPEVVDAAWAGAF